MRLKIRNLTKKTENRIEKIKQFCVENNGSTLVWVFGSANDIFYKVIIKTPKGCIGTQSLYNFGFIPLSRLKIFLRPHFIKSNLGELFSNWEKYKLHTHRTEMIEFKNRFESKNAAKL